MLARRSGVRPLAQPWAKELPVRFAAEAAADPVEVVDRVQARRTGPLRAAGGGGRAEAWADAGSPAVDPNG